MCDTFVVLPSYTRSGSTIFGKNSDREPNEAQVIEYYPRKAQDATGVRCTHMTIPSVSETCAVLISRPFWMFGAEMGVNEHGVSIGNEAVFTRMKHEERGLLGMDMLRIALERSNNAKSALSTITGLLEEYGQGGTNSYFRRNYFYDNSFLISDQESAWVLETAGPFWVAKEVHDYYSISNILTIHEDYDLSSPSLETEAAAKGHWSGPSQRLDFAKAFEDRLYTGLGKGSKRLDCTRSAMSESSRKFDLDGAKSLLRSHEKAQGGLRKGSAGDVCMHAGSLFSPYQTASSMITTLQDGTPLAYATGSSLPCSSVFKPHVVIGDQFIAYTSAGADFDPSSFWWVMERRHRTGYIGKNQDIRFDLESELAGSFCDLMKEKPDPKTMVEFSKSCYARELTQLGSVAVPSSHVNRYWKNMNKKAHLG